MNGFLLVDKPAGPSSHDVIAEVRKVMRMKQVGHAGTLDPAASGLLTIALGNCTKLLQFLVLKDKSYTFELVLGEQTFSDDDTGEVIAEADFGHIDREGLERCLKAFVGEGLEQVPPDISAIRIKGRRAHRLARAGRDFEMPTKRIDIYRLQLLDFSEETGVAQLEIDCGSGTYVRALCRDIGLALGSVGHARKIRRTKVGYFTLERAVPFEEMTRQRIREKILTDQEMLGRNLKIYVPDYVAWRLGMGQKVFVEIENFEPERVTEFLSIIDENDVLIGVGRAHRVDTNGLVLAPKTMLKPRSGLEVNPPEPPKGVSQAWLTSRKMR